MTPTTARLALEALKEIVGRCKSIKESLDSSIAIGEPVNPISASLTWPMSTCIGAIAAIESELAQPVEPILFVQPEHLSEQIKRAAHVGHGATVITSTSKIDGMVSLYTSPPIPAGWKLVPVEPTLALDIPKERLALNVRHQDCHKAADAFWSYWNENGETHKHGYYESTWGAINRALRTVGVVENEYMKAAASAIAAAPKAMP